MKIVACVKHVPDVQGDRAIAPDGRVLRDRGECSLDEADQHTVEAALALARTGGASGGAPDEVVVLTMGPPHAMTTLRRALQMGADRGVLVTDPALAGSDVFATAAVLAAAVLALEADGDVDLVLTGASSSDGGMAVLPVLLAAELGLPWASPATELTVAGGAARVRCDVAGGSELLDARLPAVVGVGRRLNRPRYPTSTTIRDARSRPVTTWTLAALCLDPARVGTVGARVGVHGAERRTTDADRVLLEDDGTAATALATYLVEQGLA